MVSSKNKLIFVIMIIFIAIEDTYAEDNSDAQKQECEKILKLKFVNKSSSRSCLIYAFNNIVLAKETCPYVRGYVNYLAESVNVDKIKPPMTFCANPALVEQGVINDSGLDTESYERYKNYYLCMSSIRLSGFVGDDPESIFNYAFFELTSKKVTGNVAKYYFEYIKKQVVLKENTFTKKDWCFNRGYLESAGSSNTGEWQINAEEGPSDIGEVPINTKVLKATPDKKRTVFREWV